MAKRMVRRHLEGGNREKKHPRQLDQHTQRIRGVSESRQDGELGGLVWQGRMVFWRRGLLAERWLGFDPEGLVCLSSSASNRKPNAEVLNSKGKCVTPHSRKS